MFHVLYHRYRSKERLIKLELDGAGACSTREDPAHITRAAPHNTMGRFPSRAGEYRNYNVNLFYIRKTKHVKTASLCVS